MLLEWWRLLQGKCIDCGIRIPRGARCVVCSMEDIGDHDEVEPVEETLSEGRPTYFEE